MERVTSFLSVQTETPMPTLLEALMLRCLAGNLPEGGILESCTDKDCQFYVPCQRLYRAILIELVKGRNSDQLTCRVTTDATDDKRVKECRHAPMGYDLDAAERS